MGTDRRTSGQERTGGWAADGRRMGGRAEWRTSGRGRTDFSKGKTPTVTR